MLTVDLAVDLSHVVRRPEQSYASDGRVRPRRQALTQHRSLGLSFSTILYAMGTPLSRRQLLTATISGAAAFAVAGRAQEKNWQAGAVRHLLPGVSHDRLLLKASFVR